MRQISAVLEARLAVATLNGFSVMFVISRSCPQGDVLSPFLRCLVVDDVLARLRGGGIFIQAHADDVCLLAVSNFPNTV